MHLATQKQVQKRKQQQREAEGSGETVFERGRGPGFGAQEPDQETGAEEERDSLAAENGGCGEIVRAEELGFGVSGWGMGGGGRSEEGLTSDMVGIWGTEAEMEIVGIMMVS